MSAPMNELIEGIQILSGYELLAPTDRVAAVRMVNDLAESKGEGCLGLSRAVARGELAAEDALEVINKRPHTMLH